MQQHDLLLVAAALCGVVASMLAANSVHYHRLKAKVESDAGDHRMAIAHYKCSIKAAKWGVASCLLIAVCFVLLLWRLP